MLMSTSNMLHIAQKYKDAAGKQLPDSSAGPSSQDNQKLVEELQRKLQQKEEEEANVIKQVSLVSL